MLVANCLSLIGPAHFLRLRRWLHGEGGAMLVVYGKGDVELLVAGSALVMGATVLFFGVEGFCLLE